LYVGGSILGLDLCAIRHVVVVVVIIVIVVVVVVVVVIVSVLVVVVLLVRLLLLYRIYLMGLLSRWLPGWLRYLV
jgi:hypothetical protein